MNSDSQTEELIQKTISAWQGTNFQHLPVLSSDHDPLPAPLQAIKTHIETKANEQNLFPFPLTKDRIIPNSGPQMPWFSEPDLELSQIVFGPALFNLKVNLRSNQGE